MDPSNRILRARLGGLTRASKYDSTEMTAAARQAFNDRFSKQVDPENILPLAERARRAEAARKAYFTRLALKSATARRRRAAVRGGDAA